MRKRGSGEETYPWEKQVHTALLLPAAAAPRASVHPSLRGLSLGPVTLTCAWLGSPSSSQSSLIGASPWAAVMSSGTASKTQ